MANSIAFINWVCFVFLFAISMYGWGSLAREKKATQENITLTITLGLGIFLAIGGILNALQLAQGWAINVTAGIGLALALLKVRRFPEFLSNITRELQKHPLAALGTAISLTLLSALVLSIHLNPDAYNYHDDFQKYFIHVAKMLETGSAHGSPLSTIGKDVLGGQAFAQGFFVHNLGLSAINVFDAVFCLILLATLLIEWGWRNHSRWIPCACFLLIVFIAPQYVNVSALYSAALFMTAAILLGAELLEQEFTKKRLVYFSVSAGILYASLPALKTPYAIFPLVHFFVFMGLVAIATRKYSMCTKLLPLVPVTGALLLLAWLYFPIIYLMQGVVEPAVINHQPFDFSLLSVLELMSTRPNFYGGFPLQFSLVVILGLFATIATFFLSRKDAMTVTIPTIFVPIFATILTTIIIYIGLPGVFSPVITEWSNSFRYTIPFIIGTMPVLFLLLQIEYTKTNQRPYSQWILPVLVAGLAVQFTPDLSRRISQSDKCGSIISFGGVACQQGYRDYNTFILQGSGKEMVRYWQSLVPADEPIIAWINAAFHMDFSRNRILEVDISGLDNPWARTPDANYFIWEYRGIATRTLSNLQGLAKDSGLEGKRHFSRALEFSRLLNKLAKAPGAKIIYKDPKVVIFKKGSLK